MHFSAGEGVGIPESAPSALLYSLLVPLCSSIGGRGDVERRRRIVVHSAFAVSCRRCSRGQCTHSKLSGHCHPIPSRRRRLAPYQAGGRPRPAGGKLEEEMSLVAFAGHFQRPQVLYYTQEGGRKAGRREAGGGVWLAALLSGARSR